MTMSTQDIRATLDSLEFFRGMHADWLDMIAEIGTVTMTERGHFLSQAGKHAETFYVILSGRVAIEMSSGISGPITIENLADGDIVGWSAFQHPYVWKLDALTTEDCTLLTFDAHELRHLCHDHPDLGYAMMTRVIAVVAHRLNAARIQLLDYYA